MDADFDPSKVPEPARTSRKNKKRKSLFNKAVDAPKPIFDPQDKSYDQYLDEYYKFDCEDIIGDIPCRFKYRKVVPNSFGLTVEEILLAKDRELNKWCSLKKAVQYRPDHVEKYDQVAFEKKARNVELKKKILPSLWGETDGVDKVEVGKKRGKSKEVVKGEVEKNMGGSENNKEVEQEIEGVGESLINKTSKKKKKEKSKGNKNDIQDSGASEREISCGDMQKESLSNEESKNKRKQKQSRFVKTEIKELKECKDEKKKIKLDEDEMNKANEQQETVQNKTKNNRKKKTKTKVNQDLNVAGITDRKGEKRKLTGNADGVKNEIVKKRRRTNNNVDHVGISDARLAAYGINPKKFKNKLKYSGKNK